MQLFQLFGILQIGNVILKRYHFHFHQVMLPFIDWLCNIWGLAIAKSANIVNQYNYIPYIKFMKSISGYIVTFVCRSEFFGFSSCCCIGYRHKLVLFWIVLVRRIRCPRLRAVRINQINATLKRIFISKIWSFKEIAKPSTQYPPAYNLLN